MAWSNIVYGIVYGIVSYRNIRYVLYGIVNDIIYIISLLGVKKDRTMLYYSVFDGVRQDIRYRIRYRITLRMLLYNICAIYTKSNFVVYDIVGVLVVLANRTYYVVCNIVYDIWHILYDMWYIVCYNLQTIDIACYFSGSCQSYRTISYSVS